MGHRALVAHVPFWEEGARAIPYLDLPSACKVWLFVIQNNLV